MLELVNFLGILLVFIIENYLMSYADHIQSNVGQFCTFMRSLASPFEKQIGIFLVLVLICFFFLFFRSSGFRFGFENWSDLDLVLTVWDPNQQLTACKPQVDQKVVPALKISFSLEPILLTKNDGFDLPNQVSAGHRLKQ